MAKKRKPSKKPSKAVAAARRASSKRKPLPPVRERTPAQARELINQLLTEAAAEDDASRLIGARDMAEQYGFVDLLVLFDVADAIGENPVTLDVEEGAYRDVPGVTVFRYRLGNREWAATLSEEDADKIAVATVTQDLKDEPGIFSESFLQQHIDKDKLREWVLDAERESDYARELAKDEPDRFWKLVEQVGGDVPDPDEDGDTPEPDDEIVSFVTEALARDRASDPMAYLSEFYTDDEVMAKAIEIAGIDIEAAAEAAVRDDGAGHFLSSYDGELHTTTHGYAYWREN